MAGRVWRLRHQSGQPGVLYLYRSHIRRGGRRHRAVQPVLGQKGRGFYLPRRQPGAAHFGRGGAAVHTGAVFVPAPGDADIHRRARRYRGRRILSAHRVAVVFLLRRHVHIPGGAAQRGDRQRLGGDLRRVVCGERVFQLRVHLRHVRRAAHGRGGCRRRHCAGARGGVRDDHRLYARVGKEDPLPPAYAAVAVGRPRPGPGGATVCP